MYTISQWVPASSSDFRMREMHTFRVCRFGDCCSDLLQWTTCCQQVETEWGSFHFALSSCYKISLCVPRAPADMLCPTLSRRRRSSEWRLSGCLLFTLWHPWDQRSVCVVCQLGKENTFLYALLVVEVDLQLRSSGFPLLKLVFTMFIPLKESTKGTTVCDHYIFWKY